MIPLCIFLILIVIGRFQSCPNSIQIQSAQSQSICNYQYQIKNNTCIFSVCYLQTAQSKSAGTASWIQCFAQCCQADQMSGDNSLALLYHCQQQNKKHDRLIIGLTVGISFSVMITIVILYACCKIQSCPLSKLAKNIKQKHEYKVDQDLNGINRRVEAMKNPAMILFQGTKSQLFPYLSIQRQENSVQSYNVTKNIRLLQAKCVICQGVKPLCHLTCNHYFHIKCIGTWLQKQNVCASCGTKDLKYVHTFCFTCRQPLQVLSITKFKSKFRKDHVFQCSQCRDEKSNLG